jgi:hypothetical protein
MMNVFVNQSGTFRATFTQTEFKIEISTKLPIEFYHLNLPCITISILNVLKSGRTRYTLADCPDPRYYHEAFRLFHRITSWDIVEQPPDDNSSSSVVKRPRMSSSGKSAIKRITIADLSWSDNEEEEEEENCL